MEDKSTLNCLILINSSLKISYRCFVCYWLELFINLFGMLYLFTVLMKFQAIIPARWYKYFLVCYYFIRETYSLLFCVNFCVSTTFKIIKMDYEPGITWLWVLLKRMHKISWKISMVWWVLKHFIQFALWPFQIVINSGGLYFCIGRHFYPEKNKKEGR